MCRGGGEKEGEAKRTKKDYISSLKYEEVDTPVRISGQRFCLITWHQHFQTARAKEQTCVLVLSPASPSWFSERCGSNFLLCKTACLQRRLSSSQLRLAMTQEGKNTKVLSNALITLCLGTSAVFWHARGSSSWKTV